MERELYQSRIFRRDAGYKFCQQSMKCCVEIISTLHQSVIPRIEKLVFFVHFKGCRSAIHLFMEFPQYLLSSKRDNPIHQSSTAGLNPRV